MRKTTLSLVERPPQLAVPENRKKGNCGGKIGSASGQRNALPLASEKGAGEILKELLALGTRRAEKFRSSLRTTARTAGSGSHKLDARDSWKKRLLFTRIRGRRSYLFLRVWESNQASEKKRRYGGTSREEDFTFGATGTVNEGALKNTGT